MQITTTNKEVVEEVPWGIWMWMMPDGKLVGDGEGRYLMLSGTKTDPRRKKILEDFVKSEFGITEGQAVYRTGHRPVDDDEYEEQLQRMKFGLTPDKMDVASAREDIINARKRR